MTARHGRNETFEVIDDHLVRTVVLRRGVHLDTMTEYYALAENA